MYWKNNDYTEGSLINCENCNKDFQHLICRNCYKSNFFKNLNYSIGDSFECSLCHKNVDMSLDFDVSKMSQTSSNTTHKAENAIINNPISEINHSICDVCMNNLKDSAFIPCK